MSVLRIDFVDFIQKHNSDTFKLINLSKYLIYVTQFYIY